MADRAAVNQAVAVKDKGCLAASGLRRRGKCRKQLDRGAAAGSTPRDNKVKYRGVFRTTVCDSSVSAGFPGRHGADADGRCCTGVAVFAIRTGRAGRSGRTSWACGASRASGTARSSCSARSSGSGWTSCTCRASRACCTTRTSCSTRSSRSARAGCTAGANGSGGTSHTAGTSGTGRTGCSTRAGCACGTARTNCAGRTGCACGTGRTGRTCRTSGSRRAGRPAGGSGGTGRARCAAWSHRTAFAAKTARPRRAGRPRCTGRPALAAVVRLAAYSIHPIAGRTVSAVPSVESRAIVHIVLPFGKFAGIRSSGTPFYASAALAATVLPRCAK